MLPRNLEKSSLLCFLHPARLETYSFDGFVHFHHRRLWRFRGLRSLRDRNNDGLLEVRERRSDMDVLLFEGPSKACEFWGYTRSTSLCRVGANDALD